MPELMRNSDAFTWQMEHEPGLRSTVVTIFRLDRAPDWTDLVGRFERMAATLPMFRQRVVENAPPAPPRWEPDPDFDLTFHVHRMIAPSPGSFDYVLELARQAEMADFDRARPLWEITLVEGLAGGAAGEGRGRGSAALLCKLHHSLTDGVGGVEIAMNLFDLAREGTERGPVPRAPRRRAPEPSRDCARSAEYDAGLAGAAARTLVTSAPRAAYAAVRRPVASTRGAVGDGGLGLPDRPPPQPHRVEPDEGPPPDPQAGGPRGARWRA